jgi:hypothetical protein
MPFTQQMTFPPNAPDVKVFFTGLMLIKPAAADDRTCEVWVHRGAPEHELTIEVRQKQAGRPDLIMMRHVGLLPYAFPSDESHPDDPPVHGFKLQVKTAPKGVRSYMGPDTARGEEALTEAVNFQSPQYHNGRVGGIDEIGGRPSILLNDGLFYVADKTSRDTIITLERDGMSAVQIDPIASLIGANIYLDAGDSLLVRWHAQGVIKRLELNKPAAGISYEIYVINDPLFESEITGIPPHDEFEEYYKLLREVRPSGAPPTTPLRPFRLEHQFRLRITPPGEAPRKGSTTIPCMPGTLIDP